MKSQTERQLNLLRHMGFPQEELHDLPAEFFATALKNISADGPVQLTGPAALCAAIAAGIPVRASEITAAKVTLTTAFPVSVWIKDGLIQVFTI